jgi:hypothetical protein
MRIRQISSLTPIVALLLLTACTPVRGAIGPNEHFQGLVNGSDQDPVVHTVCPGPAVAGRVGTVAGGQTLSVVRVTSGGGDTGVFSSIRTWVDPSVPAPPGAPPSLTFTTYGTGQTIPANLSVPCDGPGRMVFSSCPYLAPCAAGFVQDFVDVQFVNIAD